MSTDNFRHRVEYHLAHADVSVEDHLRRLRLQAYRRVAGKARIYLDSRYWIFLRDAAANRPKLPVHGEILALARQLAASSRAVFPISAASFIELMGQPHSDARLNTAHLIEELSCGVAVCVETERIPTEIAHAFYKHAGRGKVRELEELVWVSTGAVFGPIYPKNPNLDAASNLAAQKVFLDTLWEASLPPIVNVGPEDRAFPAPDSAGIAERLTENNRKHVGDVGHSFKQTYLNEIAAALDLFRDVGAQIMLTMHAQEHPEAPPPTDADRKQAAQSVYSFLVRAAEQGAGPAIFPSLDVQARIHAAIRRDTRRPFKKNDLSDIHHAMAAIPYCHAFFTEVPLHEILASPHSGIKMHYPCAVLHAERDAAAYLRNLIDAQ